MQTREEINKKQREYRVNNLEKIKAREKRNRIKRKEKIKEYQKQYYITNKTEILIKTRENQLKRQYNITIKEYTKLFNRQEGKCAICGRHQNEFIQRFHVDHDHISGKIRGLLCYHCNPMLGYAKNDINILKNAIKYLKIND